MGRSRRLRRERSGQVEACQSAPKAQGVRESRFCKCLSRLEFFWVTVSICRKNTITPKGTLLMALLRSVGVPCRFHGFTIDKALQKGAITGIAYVLAPQRILHSWVEVWFEGRWVCLEGFILDAQYLGSLQRRFPGARRFCGFGAATPDLSAPAVEWRGQDTFIQKEGIVDDFGTFDDPDAFYARHGANLRGPKRWLFVHAVRRWMNDNVARVRAGQ